MKESQPINIENLTIKGINNFFEESKKVTYGEVLTSVFQDFTLDKSRELRGNMLIGKTKNKENSPLIVLRDLRGVKELWLQVFHNERYFNKSSGSGDLVFITGEARQTIVFDLKSNTYSLSDKYAGFLIKVLGEVNSKFKKAKFGK
jgi:hypothetical protein